MKNAYYFSNIDKPKQTTQEKAAVLTITTQKPNENSLICETLQEICL